MCSHIYGGLQVPVTVPSLGMVGGGGDGDAKVLGLSLENLMLSEGDTGQVWITHPLAEKQQERCLVKKGVKGLPFWVHSMFSPFPDHAMLTHRSVTVSPSDFFWWGIPLHLSKTSMALLALVKATFFERWIYI